VGLLSETMRNILATMCTTKSFIIDPTVFVAAWKAVKFGRKRVIVEGYTLKIVNMLRKEDCCKSRYGQLINRK
jgi:hypothetical protein